MVLCVNRDTGVRHGLRGGPPAAATGAAGVRPDGRPGDDDGDGKPAYRLYEVQNGNHIETYKGFFPQLEFIEPVAQAAFDALVAHVEQRNALPSSRCIGRGFKDGDRISTAPAQPGHCANLFVP